MELHNDFRIWFANVKNLEEMHEALSQLKGLAEEVILSGKTFKLEIWTQKRLPQTTSH